MAEAEIGALVMALVKAGVLVWIIETLSEKF
jgi:hypothetical protein